MAKLLGWSKSNEPPFSKRALQDFPSGSIWTFRSLETALSPVEMAERERWEVRGEWREVRSGVTFIFYFLKFAASYLRWYHFRWQSLQDVSTVRAINNRGIAACPFVSGEPHFKHMQIPPVPAATRRSLSTPVDGALFVGAAGEHDTSEPRPRRHKSGHCTCK